MGNSIRPSINPKTEEDKMKVCRKCKIEKNTNEFYINKNHKDGYSSYCKECKKQYYQANKIKILEKNRMYRETLHDSYIKSLLQKSTRCPSSKIPQEIVDTQKVIIVVKREIRNSQKNKTPSPI